jgi:hypothetical protein
MHPTGLKNRGASPIIEKVGIQPRGKAKWCVAEADPPEVRSQRGKTEGVIGTLKSRSTASITEQREATKR